MSYILTGIKEAFQIILSLDREFLDIVWVSGKVSIISTSLATSAGVPFAIFITRKNFPGRHLLITILNTLMALPTVVVGLTVYSFLSRSGPFGSWGLLFSQTAIIIGQVILIVPIITSLTISALKGADPRIEQTAMALGADTLQQFRIFFHEARFGVFAAIIAGFGRVFAEVGISMMLGGNIRNYTRTITTNIVLETSKGEFAMGIALGIVLLTVAFGINIIFSRFQKN